MHRSRSRLVRTVLATTALLVVTVAAAPAGVAAPTLSVSATDGLEDGQTITVQGGGFAPGLQGIAVGQCVEGYTGPADCNLKGGATFRNADADGAIAPVTIKLAERFGKVDCTKDRCLIAAAPLPTTSSPEEVKANTVEVPISFGAAAPAKASAKAAAEQPAAPAATSAAAALPTLRESGSGHTLPVLLIAANLLVAAAGLYLGIRRRPAGATR